MASFMRGWALFVATVAALTLCASAQTTGKVALVIGNGGYVTPGWALANPPRDARLMAERLRSLGFDVDLVVDAKREDMEAAFARFGQRLKRAGSSGVGFFYYAGHGAQSNGVNLLVPVDSTARTMDRLRLQAPPMQFLLDDMAEAGNAVNIIVLDACRNVPLEEGFRDGAGGLADVGRLPNVFIAFAAAPGRTAADGGGSNSPFTASLARALSTRADQPISLLFEDVQAEVYRSTRGAQNPEFRNGLVRAPGWSMVPASSRASEPRPSSSCPDSGDVPGGDGHVNRLMQGLLADLLEPLGVGPEHFRVRWYESDSRDLNCRIDAAGFTLCPVALINAKMVDEHDSTKQRHLNQREMSFVLGRAIAHAVIGHDRNLLSVGCARGYLPAEQDAADLFAVDLMLRSKAIGVTIFRLEEITKFLPVISPTRTEAERRAALIQAHLAAKWSEQIAQRDRETLRALEERVSRAKDGPANSGRTK